MQKGCCRMACTPLRLPMVTRKHQSRYVHLMGLLQAWLYHNWSMFQREADRNLALHVMR